MTAPVPRLGPSRVDGEHYVATGRLHVVLPGKSSTGRPYVEVLVDDNWFRCPEHWLDDLDAMRGQRVLLRWRPWWSLRFAVTLELHPMSRADQDRHGRLGS